MIHALKSYQRESLLALRDFWTRCAAPEARGKPEKIVEAFAASAGILGSAYLHAPGLNTVPSVCVKIPTGGGKTFVAASACGIANAAYLQREHPLIVWLAPTGTIVDQTLAALRRPQHPCHGALVAGSEVSAGLGAIRPVTIDEALSLTPAAYAAASVIIVATVQQFRVDSTEGRRVYADNGTFRELLPAGVASLARLIAHHQPLIIVDEAHNVRTERSFEALARLDPALVLEISATPSRRAECPSNVVYSASPLELFNEGMVRLPIEVAANQGLDPCLEWALATRERLQRDAEAEAAGAEPRIRPLLLIQAEATQQSAATDDEVAIERKLIEDFKLPREQIAVHTGKRRDLDGVDLLAADCPVTIIITKEALKEGWDCPWAYVLCTLRNSLTDKDAVQLVGRILRQYQAVKRPTPSLNKAYVVARCATIGTALEELRGSLVMDLGYDAGLASMQVQSAQLAITLPFHAPLPLTELRIDPERARALPPELSAKLSVDPHAGKVTFLAATTLAEDRLVAGIFERPQDAAAYAAAARSARTYAIAPGQELTLAAAADERTPLRVARLTVPGLSPGVQEVIADHHFEPEAYQPSPGSHLLSFIPSDQVMGRGRTMVASGSIVFQVDEEGEALTEMVDSDRSVALSHFLSSRIAALCFRSTDRPRWIADALGHLRTVQSLAMPALWLDRYRLLATAQSAIDADIERACRAAIQTNLFSAGKVRASDAARDFVFRPQEYPAGSFDASATSWTKHYYRPRPAEMRQQNERACALEIDRHANVESWVRNLVHPRCGFRIPRMPHGGNQWFYPDFIVWLKRGRVLVVEHKGQLEQREDVDDKLNAGNFWAARTGNLFVMSRDDANGEPDFSELRRVLAANG